MANTFMIFHATLKREVYEPGTININNIVPFTQIGASKASIRLVLVGYLIVLILLAIASLVVYRSMWYDPFNQKDHNEQHNRTATFIRRL